MNNIQPTNNQPVEPSLPQTQESQATIEQNFASPKIKPWILVTIIFLGLLLIGTGLWFGFKLNTNNKIQNDQQIRNLIDDQIVAAKEFKKKEQTYWGFQVAAEKEEKIQSLGSQVFVQALQIDNFMVYAKLPYVNKYYCVDSLGNKTELENITSDRINCDRKE